MTKEVTAEPAEAAPATNPLEKLSDDSVLAEIVRHCNELARRHLAAMLAGEQPIIHKSSAALPFSRAEGTDYLRIVELWNDYVGADGIDLPPRACPACKSSDSRPLFKSYDRYPYHSCNSCGMWYVPHLVDDRVTDAFFETVPEARALSDTMMRGREARTRAGDRARFSIYFELLQPLFAARPGSLRYVDIGCGVGHSVELAKEFGWNALGVELNEVAVRTAREHGRNVIRPDDWHDDEPYGLVSIFEALEHITDPDSMVAHAARLLAPNGLIVITVPNRASFEVSMLRDRCFHVFGGSENVGHINLFDAATLDVLLRRHGLSLMFTDGQYSSDLMQIFSQLTDRDRPVLDVARNGRIDLEIPQPFHALLNNLGPVLAVLERACKKSPILIAIACRSTDETVMKPAFEELGAAWRQKILQALSAI